jgi:hypothetical protein
VQTIAYTYHHEAESIPEGIPASRAVGFQVRLTMDRYHMCWGLTDRASRDILLDVNPSDWHHHGWKRRVGTEPVTVVIPRSVVTDIVEITEEEGHG